MLSSRGPILSVFQWSLWACGLWFAVAVPELTAQDRVTIQRSNGSSRISISGRIRDFTGEALTLETGSGAGIQRFPTEEVVEVQTGYVPAHEQARQLMNAGQWTQAAEQLTAALDAENRTWVRREILALQVRCALQQREYSRAVSRFLAITQSDPMTPHYRLIPLVWTQTTPGRIPEAEAQSWLNSSDLPARLIGASWLLFGDSSSRARSTLMELAKDPHPYGQRLAQAQIWRIQLAERAVAAAELARWEKLTDDWSPVIRGGPLFLLGEAHAQREEWIMATAHWLWVAFEFSDRRDLAAQAQLRAARGMELAGDLPSAARLASELTTAYPDQPEAAEARELWERLSTSPSPATMPGKRSP